MIWLLILSVMFVSAILVFRQFEDVGIMMGAVTIVASLVVAIILLGAHMSYAGERAQFDALKEMVERGTIPAAKAEDVIGLAAQANQALAERTAYNRRWWSKDFIPDGWETATPIRLGGEEPR